MDIGFGTGTLTTKLYEQGYNIYGQDFSDKMVELAKNKMPNSKLFKGDFSNGLVEELRNQKYDAIIATYSLHHLTDKDKVKFIKELIGLLNEKAIIYIGDVAFETRKDLEKCKEQCMNLNSKKNKHLLKDSRVEKLLKNGEKTVADLYIENDRPIFTEKVFEQIADFIKQNELFKLKEESNL